ncbi:Death on curing protein, Doc toxin (plasmid) [Rhodovulum sp. P5]|uniref:type II toxin-antitoxin system VapC family toxin n=1 Tax=Rhodovulum sp. P5 TaxID=1564506 RepID=UPI0009C2952F|nr:type II toxin-antitoxin system VapC family toxin [Rhodovulum sp. P5]ARE42316.1 Death on curing protein, Doc toxin [Rhodovulum sp. P5]
MNLLLDTHYLLWVAGRDSVPNPAADALIKDPANSLWFSVASLWEVAIKRALDRPDFRTDPGTLRAGLIASGYRELPVEGRHVLGLATLPALHRDPFDRMLVAQAAAEGMRLLTADTRLAAYGGPVLAL